MSMPARLDDRATDEHMPATRTERERACRNYATLVYWAAMEPGIEELLPADQAAEYASKRREFPAVLPSLVNGTGCMDLTLGLSVAEARCFERASTFDEAGGCVNRVPDRMRDRGQCPSAGDREPPARPLTSQEREELARQQYVDNCP